MAKNVYKNRGFFGDGQIPFVMEEPLMYDGDIVPDDPRFDPSQYGNIEMGNPDELLVMEEEEAMKENAMDEIGMDEIGYIDEIGAMEEIGDMYEIGATDEIGARVVRAVVKKARDNRQRAPRMRAVAVDAPRPDYFQDFLSDVVMGAAAATGDSFPITSKLLLRFGACHPGRRVRVDTEESYVGFRAASSPDLAERVRVLEERLNEHVNDPSAHSRIVVGLASEIGAELASKRIDLCLPKWAQGKVDHWVDGDLVGASMNLPGPDGEVRICSAMMPIEVGVEEIGRHAVEAAEEEGFPVSAVVGCLHAMGICLGAGTLLKEMAAAAPSILARPEAALCEPFVVRIEPKSSPTLCALVALVQECKAGNKAACAEWKKLVKAAESAPPVAKAMREAVKSFGHASTVMGKSGILRRIWNAITGRR